MVSKYAKNTIEIYQLSMCTLISIKIFEAWSTVKSKKLSDSSDRNLKNVYYALGSKFIMSIVIQLLPRIFLVALWCIKNPSDRLTNLKIDPAIASLIDDFTYWCCIHTRTLIISNMAVTLPCYWFVTTKFSFWFIGTSIASVI